MSINELIDFLLNYKFTVSGLLFFSKLIILYVIVVNFIPQFIIIFIEAWVKSKNFSNPKKVIEVLRFGMAALIMILFIWFIFLLLSHKA